MVVVPNELIVRVTSDPNTVSAVLLEASMDVLLELTIELSSVEPFALGAGVLVLGTVLLVLLFPARQLGQMTEVVVDVKE